MEITFINKKLKQIISNQLSEEDYIPAEKILDTDTPYFLGLDSIDLFDISVIIERELNIDFPYHKLDGNSTIEEIVTLIYKSANELQTF